MSTNIIEKRRVSSYDDWLSEHLSKNPELAMGYLQDAFEDEDPRMFLLALARVAKAQGGLAALAKKTGLNRETLYRTLSLKGNPKLQSIDAILRSLGMRLSVERLPEKKKKRAHKTSAND
jgi:probable addiction module antidote protein